MEISTIGIDLDEEAVEKLYEVLNTIAIQYCDQTSYSIFSEAIESGLTVEEVAGCLGKAILNAFIVDAVMKKL